MSIWLTDYENSSLDFKLNLWNWRPIAKLICESGCISNGDIEIFERGHGGLDLNEARDLAQYIRDNFLNKMSKESKIDLDGEIVSLVSNKLLNRDDITENYGASFEILSRFVLFLEKCNGFSVR